MKVGILGGGQLSRMLAFAGMPMGIDFAFYEPAAENCVAYLGPVTCADYMDFAALEKFVKQVDVVTYENENIPVPALEFIRQFCPVHPNAKAIGVAQDRLLEKNFFRSVGIKTAAFAEINSHQDILDYASRHNFPFILKKRCNGYDGKGQFKLKSMVDVKALTEDDCVHCIVEAVVPFDREVSGIAVRSQAGEIRFYDLNENEHREGVLYKTHNKIADPMQATLNDYLTTVLEALDYVGVLTVEFFQLGGALIVNEMAPRVHNSGHWTIEGAVVSQFANHLRAILNLPLGACDSRAPIEMTNILGEMPDMAAMLQQPGVYLHDYQKSPRPGRKLGHLTRLL